jgi:predicted nucleic acid-binding protein
LYHEKRDNKNLSKKMAAYFLEHVRTRYKLSTNQLDDEFISSLRRKTAQPVDNIKNIVSFINNMEDADEITDERLADFHKELEEFYERS